MTQAYENKLRSCHQTAQDWDHPLKIKKALSIVPLEDLHAIAQAKYDSSIVESSSANISLQESQGIVRDLVLLELLNWFKNDFFTWMNSPNCPICDATAVSAGSGAPTQIEIAQSVSRVEIYRCPRSGCGSEHIRFPRHNDAGILLDTRTGRCGEWANCFGLICRAVGYDTRYVYDFTDHVWVEVFSSGMKPRNRWLHCDPCENTCDNPLLYEAGWGKKLTFVIGASIDDIQDVTWRYTHSQNLKEILARRNCDERRIVDAVVRVRRAIQQNLSSNRKNVLNKRLIEELVDFICPTGETKKSEHQGRESGSLAWRLARQEIGGEGDASASASAVRNSHEWKILPSASVDNILNLDHTFQLTYDPIGDNYVSVSDINSHDKKILHGWKNGTYAVNNIFRKEERDWKMVYLARQENRGSSSGKISWKFTVPDDLSTKGIKIRKVQIVMRTKIFHNSAKIRVRVSDDASAEIIPEVSCVDGVWTWVSDGILHGEGSKTCIIECELSGGSGDVSWQHAQLFRTSTSDHSRNLQEPLFCISIAYR